MKAKFSPGVFVNHSPYDATTHARTMECSMTPLWKLWNCSFHPCCIIGVWTHWFTVPFHSSEFVLWQSLPERVGFAWKSVEQTWRNDCIFWKWNVNNQICQRHTNWETYWHSLSTLLHPPRKQHWSDISQMLSGQSVEPTSLLRRSEGGVLAMQCNFRRLSYRVFTNN